MKRVRRLFLACYILFCINDRCSMPLHTLLTDTIESQGGSTLLVQMLNRLGVCASADTFIQFKMSNCNTSLMKYLQPDMFTCISADNIDFMHSYAECFVGNKRVVGMEQLSRQYNHYHPYPLQKQCVTYL